MSVATYNFRSGITIPGWALAFLQTPVSLSSFSHVALARPVLRRAFIPAYSAIAMSDSPVASWPCLCRALLLSTLTEEERRAVPPTGRDT